MKRARAEGKTPEVAAKEYFLPDYYYQSPKKYEPSEKARENDQKQGADESAAKGIIPNYFQGMDTVVVNPAADPSNPVPVEGQPSRPPFQLDTPVFQLLDNTQPKYAFKDAVTTENEILGRNTWMMWTGGNEGFWDWLATDSLGFIDLLRIVDTRQRQHRFEVGGLINEPGMAQNGHTEVFGLWLDQPNDQQTRAWRSEYLKKTFDLIAERKHSSQRGLFDDGAYSYGSDKSRPIPAYSAKMYDEEGYNPKKDRSIPPPSIYGISSGVVGLRLYPNPRFDADAQQKWDAERYYNDPEYYNDPKLIRPFRVGVACAYCHASFHPLNPPNDIHNPEWENLSGNIGAQYLRIRHAFGNVLKPDNFVYHLLDSQPPGTIDTSLIASDNINNPNTMNSVFGLTQRALLSFRNPQENLTRTSANQPVLWRATPVDLIPPYLAEFAKRQNALEVVANANNTFPERYVPRILLDGSDGIGGWGALARVYLNIGTYYEQWIRLHRTVIGFEKQRPFTIVDCEHNSVYWHATQDRVHGLRDYFLKASPPMPLVAAAVGKRQVDRLNSAAPEEQNKESAWSAPKNLIDSTKLQHGRKVFARNCIVCHSSIQPESSAVTLFDNDEARTKYNARFATLIKARMDRRNLDRQLGEFWEHDPGQWFRNADYLQWAEEIVEESNFWQYNYLSTDYRIPVNIVNTNSGRAMATNALDGNMWDDFASLSYQHMPAVGTIDYFNPYKGPKGGPDQYQPRHKAPAGTPVAGGGPGFYRVPTLLSIWSTAPYLHNNSLGKFTNDPSLKGRMTAFDDGIEKLLWPEKRLLSSAYNNATPERLKADHGLVWRTPDETYLTISGRRVPTLLSANVRAVMEIKDRYPWLEEVRPTWLPTGILVLASFLLLVFDCQRKRHRAGWVLVGLAGVQLLIGWAHQQWQWFEWIEHINPIWLPLVLTLITGVLMLVLDDARKFRIFALFGVAVGILGLIFSKLLEDNKWVQRVLMHVPISWLCGILIAASIVLLATRWRSWLRLAIAGLLFLGAAVGVVVFLHDGYAGDAAWANYIGPVWIYSVLLASGGVLLLVPDTDELRRYLGYSSLILGLSAGAALYFFSGKLGDIKIGPIPKGTPVSLLANLNPDAEPKELAKAIGITISTFAEINSKHLTSEQADKLLRERVAPALMKVNKCPDFVMDKGHYFEWFQAMSDDDKRCLIELLKTF